MARKIKDYVFKGKQPSPSPYDWDAWLDGDPWELVRGTDYTIASATLIAKARKVLLDKDPRSYLARDVLDGGAKVVIRAEYSSDYLSAHGHRDPGGNGAGNGAGNGDPTASREPEPGAGPVLTPKQRAAARARAGKRRSDNEKRAAKGMELLPDLPCPD